MATTGSDKSVELVAVLPGGPSAGDHVLEIVLRGPAELTADAVRAGHHPGRVAGSPLDDDRFDVTAGHPRNGVEHLAHAGPLAAADVEDAVGSAVAGGQIFQCGDMRIGDVDDGDVVADARPVRGRVVVAEDARALAGDDALERHRDQVENTRV